MFPYILARLLLVIGGMNYLTMSTVGVNMFSLLTKNATVLRLLGLLIGCAAAVFAFDRDYYLPFLGACAVPHNVCKKELPSSMSHKIKLTGLPPNVDVVYWAANPNENVFPNPAVAYENYNNTGASRTDASGTAIIRIQCPGLYEVNKFGMRKTIPRHVHYRYSTPTGLMSKVFTQFVDKNCE